jgi:hypothetical protein
VAARHAQALLADTAERYVTTTLFAAKDDATRANDLT